MSALTPKDWPAIRAAAAGWVVRLGAQPSETDRAAFEAWLDADVAHEIAYEQEKRTWDRLSGFQALGAFQDELQQAASRPAAAARPKGPSRRALLGGGLAAAASAAGAAFWFGTAPDAYATGVGEQRTVKLPGGGSLELNTDTALSVKASREGGRIVLEKGEALLDLAQGQGRYTVDMGLVTLAADRCTVSCLRRPDGVELAVIAGAATMSGKSAPVAQTGLRPGDRARVTAAGLQRTSVTANELTRRLAWRDGHISLAGETLREAAAEFNRYNTKKIFVDDPSIGSLSVGGYFSANDPTGFVRALEKSFDIVATDRGRSLHLSART